MGRTPTRQQNQEAVKRLNALKKLWNLKTDKELAERLHLQAQNLVHWKARGLTVAIQSLIDEILEGKEGQFRLLCY